MDYGIKLDHIPIKCDNTSTINLSKNPIQHSRTKYIDIKHHFLHDHVQNGDISLEFVDTNNQLADIFTKPLNEERLNFIKYDLGMIDGSSLCWLYVSLLNWLLDYFKFHIFYVKSITLIIDYVDFDLNIFLIVMHL